MSAAAERLAQAQQQVMAGRFDQARQTVLAVLRKTPADPNANCMMCFVLAKSGQHRQALHFIQQALRAAPDNPDFLANLGQLHADLGEHAQAVEVLERAVAAGPDNAFARLNLAIALLALRRFANAARHAEEVRRIEPANPRAALTLGVSFIGMMRADDAVRMLADAVRLQPARLESHNALCFAANCAVDLDAEAALRLHESFGRMVEANAPAPPPLRDPDPERRLRIGFMSGDLGAHSVSFFLEPLLERLDRDRFELLCYATSQASDSTTERLKRLASTWRAVSHIALSSLVETIRKDGIDVLIDLSGHTANNRLMIFPRRPAPVQVTYLGYPNTTGLRSIDWRIVDSFTDPPGAEACATERLWRLDPCFLCYRPPADAPEPARAAREGQGPVFGSFNAGMKLNRRVLGAWSTLLRETPGARLLLKHRDFNEEQTRVLTLEALQRAGADLDRVEILPPTKEIADHLRVYQRLDVALDTFPYNGTTTTCEALFMGVPVVTLNGAAHAGRVGVSLLSAVGLGELIAQDDASYIRIARDLALDRGRIESLRSTLRGRVLASALCDEAGFARRFEDAIREMWRQRCAAAAAGG